MSMQASERATISLPTPLAQRLRLQARVERRSVSSILREALEAYLAGQEPPPLPSFVGSGDSGRDDVSERAEDLLREHVARPDRS